MLLTCLRQHNNTTITSAVAFHSNYWPISISTHKSAGVNCYFEIKSAWSLQITRFERRHLSRSKA